MVGILAKKGGSKEGNSDVLSFEIEPTTTKYFKDGPPVREIWGCGSEPFVSSPARGRRDKFKFLPRRKRRTKKKAELSISKRREVSPAETQKENTERVRFPSNSRPQNRAILFLAPPLLYIPSFKLGPGRRREERGKINGYLTQVLLDHYLQWAKRS